jgi:hypothetical protein
MKGTFFSTFYLHIPPSHRWKTSRQDCRNPPPGELCLYIAHDIIIVQYTTCRLGYICFYPPEEEKEKYKSWKTNTQILRIPPGRLVGGWEEYKRAVGPHSWWSFSFFSNIHTHRGVVVVRSRENPLTDMFIKVGTFWLVEMWPHSGISIP